MQQNPTLVRGLHEPGEFRDNCGFGLIAQMEGSRFGTLHGCQKRIGIPAVVQNQDKGIVLHRLNHLPDVC